MIKKNSEPPSFQRGKEFCFSNKATCNTVQTLSVESTDSPDIHNQVNTQLVLTLKAYSTALLSLPRTWQYSNLQNYKLAILNIIYIEAYNGKTPGFGVFRVCAGSCYVWVCTVHMCGGQRTTGYHSSGTDHCFVLFCWDKISHWPGTCPVSLAGWPMSPRPWLPQSPSSDHEIHTWPIKQSHACKASTLSTKPSPQSQTWFLSNKAPYLWDSSVALPVLTVCSFQGCVVFYDIKHTTIDWSISFLFYFSR